MIRGPAAILFISHDTCSDSIAKLFRVCFYMGYRTVIARYVATWGIAQMCLSETKYQGTGSTPFWGSANPPEEVSRDMGYRSDSIASSRYVGPMRLCLRHAVALKTLTALNEESRPFCLGNEDRNLLKLRSLDSSWPLCLSDTSIGDN